MDTHFSILYHHILLNLRKLHVLMFIYPHSFSLLADFIIIRVHFLPLDLFDRSLCDVPMMETYLEMSLLFYNKILC